ncbi:nucleotide-binding protein [Massilia eurypsychrophila]|jgi:predicted nucleic acid-binding protein|uniref:Nucleotide-binding protein n=1 Tax=Massilia eurypsychrophila TaxID=1485217 RepID=A0A2G8TET0_9BURK|nr:PIN domain-containing protein [Massilia eurypsychrophila]PIL44555.1 nucleotide-binding protein [Massilia eurypsychrophila]
MSNKAIVLDANILIGAVLGHRIRKLVEQYGVTVSLFTPDLAWAEANRYVPALLTKRSKGTQDGMQYLNRPSQIVRIVGSDSYRGLERQAQARIGARDPNDWPVLACAMSLGCAIWTDDKDFSGVGVPVWRTGLVENSFST